MAAALGWLVVGVCINVAVALACVVAAQTLPPAGLDYLPGDEAKQLRATSHRPDVELHLSSASQMLRFGYHEKLLLSEAVDLEANEMESLQVVIIDAGWPMFALHRDSRIQMDHHEWRQVYVPDFLFGLFVGSSKSDAILWPTAPRWPGFAVNSLLYAGVLWAIFVVPGAVRRRVRTRRGQCPRCAYPIGTGDRCTECGEPLPHAAGA